MASTNFKLFDENKVNMMSDTEYNIASQRLNGVQTGIASSQLQNKTLYQTSLMSYALAQLMNANGIDANDTAAVSTFVNGLSDSIVQKVLDKATEEMAIAGSDNSHYMTPALVKKSAINLINVSNPLGAWEYKGKITKMSFDSRQIEDRDYFTVFDYGQSSGYCQELSKILIKINSINVQTLTIANMHIGLRSLLTDGTYLSTSGMSLTYISSSSELSTDKLVGGAWELTKGSIFSSSSTYLLRFWGSVGFFTSGVQNSYFAFEDGQKIKKVEITLDDHGTQGNIECDVDVYAQIIK